MTNGFDQRPKAQFVCKALGVLQKRYPGLGLIGSWATAEAHIPESQPSCAWSASFSDIDLIYGGNGLEAVTSHAREVLREACDAARLVIKGVSVRKAADILAMPHSLLYYGRGPVLRPHDALNFLKFWTAVSATEVVCLHRAQRSQLQSRVYGTVKFFFTFVRNVALIRGLELRSYEDITQWSAATLNFSPAKLAFDIKIGKTNDARASAIGSLLVEGIFITTRWADLPLLKEIEAIVEDMKAFLIRGQELDGNEYLRLAQASAYNPALVKVVKYQDVKFRSF